MKYVVAVLVLILSVAGCSKKEASSPNPEPTITASDLGKDTNYFINLYGTATSEKQASEFDFTLPAVGHLIKLNKPFVIQQYVSGKMNVVVVFADATTEAVWVKYTLPNPWTDDQIKAALGAFDNRWTATIQNNGMSTIGEVVMKSMMPAQAPSAFQSSSGILAYKTMIPELMVYSPGLVQELRQKVADEEQQKRDVPKF